MGIFRQFPYSNFHEMNLDWLLHKMDEIIAEWAAFNNKWDGVIDDFNELKEYVINYLDNLDLTAEVIAYIDQLIADGTFDEIIAGLFYGFITPEMYGAVGDDTVDDTVAIQNTINYAILNDKEIHFKHGATYKVSKNPQLDDIIVYPDNDQPCLLIINADNLTIHGMGATLHVHEHGQGILEIRRSKNSHITGLNFKGYGAFPKLDTNSGRAEKGTTGEGYYNALGTPYYEFGYMKNNSVDTSAWQGFGVDPTETWGTFGDGYIGNCASGLLIYDNCNLITVAECIADGFNYAGFEVGTKTYSNIYSYNITFQDCEAKNIYDSGFIIELGMYCNVINCYSHEIGHPDAFDANNVYQYSVADPGYGVTITRYYNSGTGYNRSAHCKVENCRITRCIRKGVDTHGGKDIMIFNNNISYCYAFGIGLTSINFIEAFTEHVQVMNNLIEYCGQMGCGFNIENSYDPNTGDMGNPIDVESGNIISNNIIKNCSCLALASYGIITIIRASKMIFSNNVIINVYPQSSNVNGILRVSGSYYSVFTNLVFETGQNFSSVVAGNAIKDCTFSNITADVPLAAGYDITDADRRLNRFVNNIMTVQSAPELTNLMKLTTASMASGAQGTFKYGRMENDGYIQLENVGHTSTASGYTDLVTLPFKPVAALYQDIVSNNGGRSRIFVSLNGEVKILTTGGAASGLGYYGTINFKVQ